MNLWIDIARESLVRTIGTVDCLILNDSEVKQLTDEPNLMRAAREVHGARPARRGRQAGRVRLGDVSRARASSACPRIPTADVVDPTGAGDTFAGGFMGYVAAHADEEIDDDCCAARWPTARRWPRSTSRRFGTERMQTLTRATRSTSAWPSCSGRRRSTPSPRSLSRTLGLYAGAPRLGVAPSGPPDGLDDALSVRLPEAADPGACYIVWWAITRRPTRRTTRRQRRRDDSCARGRIRAPRRPRPPRRGGPHAAGVAPAARPRASAR